MFDLPVTVLSVLVTMVYLGSLLQSCIVSGELKSLLV